MAVFTAHRDWQWTSTGQRFQGPPDAVVVEHLEVAGAQPERAGVMAPSPLARAVERFPVERQVRDHQPDRDLDGLVTDGASGA